METFCTPSEELPDWAKPKTKGDPPAELESNVYEAAKKTSFILGVMLLIFVAARTSITWHCQYVWGASKDFYQNVWSTMHEGLFAGNDFLLATVGSHIFLFLYFWLNSLFFMYLDIFKPTFFMKYKVQDTFQVKMIELKKAIRVCLRNQFIAFLISIPAYVVSKKRGQLYTASELPSFHWFLLELCVFVMVEEICFYYCHRLLHHRYVYRHVHKVHHEWTAPVSIIGIYAHPLEHVLSNVLPVFLGPLLLGSHHASLLLWSCIAITQTQISHGGYHLPFLPSPEAHDFHHLNFTNNFGVLGVLDRLHGTDNTFIKTKAYDRHIMLIGLAPAKERFPDDNNDDGGEKVKSS